MIETSPSLDLIDEDHGKAVPDVLNRPFPDLEERDEMRRGESGVVELLGSSCEICGSRAFPFRYACHVCGGSKTNTAAIGSSGTVYAHTRVHVSASRPVPYDLGYVDLTSGVRVLGTLRGVEGAAIGFLAHVIEVEGGWAFKVEKTA